jgi:predicted XRE-type DNA-binding protein
MSKERAFVINQGSDNIFEDLGFEKSEAANLKIRADLMLTLKKYIQSQGWTQEEAAEFFGETQPRISNLMNGEIGRFSVDKLINMLVRAGMEIKVEVVSPAA